VAVVLDREIGCEDVSTVLDESLASYKHPKSFEVVPDLPRNSMGKVLKNELRDRFSGLFSDPG